MRRPKGDDGNALVEFVYLAVLLLIPLVYLLLAAFKVQSAAFGVTEAARQAGRAYARADDPASAALVASTAARLALQDQGIAFTGAPEFCGGDGCSLAPGATVRTRVRYTVPLPFVGSIFGNGRAGIPVTGVHTEVVDRFKEAPP
jgi:Flp pilus assembly protein TadG